MAVIGTCFWAVASVAIVGIGCFTWLMTMDKFTLEDLKNFLNRRNWRQYRFSSCAYVCIFFNRILNFKKLLEEVCLKNFIVF